MYVTFTAEEATCMAHPGFGDANDEHVEVMLKAEATDAMVHFLLEPAQARDLAERLVQVADDVDATRPLRIVRASSTSCSAVRRGMVPMASR